MLAPGASDAQKLHPKEEAAERIRAAVAARRNPDFMIVARSDAFWVHRDLEDCIARLELHAEAGADMVFPTFVGPAELASDPAAPGNFLGYKIE